MHYFKLLIAASLFAAPQMHSMCKVNLKSFSAQVTAKPELLALGGAVVCAYLAYKNASQAFDLAHNARKNTEDADTKQFIGEESQSKELNKEAKNLTQQAEVHLRNYLQYKYCSWGLGALGLYLLYTKK